MYQTFVVITMAGTKVEEKRLKSIGEKLKKIRISSGYKSAEIFAYDNVLNRVQYWRMERGANFTMQSLFKILEIHEVSMEEFFQDIL